VPEGQPIGYTATVLAKRIGSGTRENPGETNGELATADQLALDIPVNRLPEGLYRLEALLDLGLASDTPNRGLP
jgi:hypothetical protein